MIRSASDPPSRVPSGGRMHVRIVPLEARHWAAVQSIFAEGIATGEATFETEVPSWTAWDRTHHPFARLVALSDDPVVGWAALSPVSPREVYRGVAEVSVYVAENYRGQGVGGALLRKLIVASEAAGVWTLQAGVFRENEASIELHRKAGFRVVGRREKLGELRGRWRDVVLLERRSETVGAD